MFTNNLSSKRSNFGLGTILFIAIFILMVVLAPQPAQSLNAQPELLALVVGQPDSRVNVIVQKNTADDSVEARVMQLGGEITQELNLINGFAAEVRAKDVAELAADARVNWVSLDAPVIRVSQVGSSTVRDEFNTLAYNNNDGDSNWANDWQEWVDNETVGETIYVTARSCEAYISTNCLYFRKDAGASRAVNLENALNATLTFDWFQRRDYTDYSMTVEIRTDTLDWVNILQFYGGNENYVHSETASIPENYLSANTEIRFNFDDWGNGYLYLDNIQIEYTMPPSSVYPESVGADLLWAEVPSIQGQQVTIAVVDSGVANHPDLQNEGDTTFRVAAEVDFLSDSSSPDDLYGHGTHVAGIIAGNGKIIGSDSHGIAPQAQLVDVKVIGDTGAGTVSDVVAGLEWIYNNKDTYSIRVVNLSLNSTIAESYHDSPLDAAVEILWFNGIVVVVSAGNNGNSTPGVLYPPANDPFVITVGAADDLGTASISDDVVTSYSAYGITTDGFAKPDLVAPGKNIISLLSGDTAKLALDHPERVLDFVGVGDYFTMSGTSMSSAVVAGAVAQLLEDEPNLTPDQVKYRLMYTTRTDWPGYDAQKAGAGYLDIYSAVHATTIEAANQNTMPHMLLAKMALIAYWANENGGEEIDWSTVDWESVNWDTVDWNSVNWGSVNWGSVNWGSVNWGSVNWGSVNWGSVNWGSVNWGSVNWGSVNWGSVNWGSVNSPSVDFSE